MSLSESAWVMGDKMVQLQLPFLHTRRSFGRVLKDDEFCVVGGS